MDYDVDWLTALKTLMLRIVAMQYVYICICVDILLAAMYVCIYSHQICTFYCRQSAAHGNFRFIGPGLVMMCHSIKEKVLSLNNDNKGIKSVKKGNYVTYICT